MAKIMMHKFFIICFILNSIVLLFLPFAENSSSSASLSTAVLCKELNQWNCYSAKNEGNFCNSKDHSKTETRWFYDKGHCRTFSYKGCNGNRNRFCSNESCKKRCQEE